MKHAGRLMALAIIFVFAVSSAHIQADVTVEPETGEGFVITNMSEQPAFATPVCYSGGTAADEGELGNCSPEFSILTSCPAAVSDVMRTTDFGGRGVLCASDWKSTPGTIPLDKFLVSFIDPICTAMDQTPNALLASLMAPLIAPVFNDALNAAGDFIEVTIGEVRTYVLLALNIFGDIYDSAAGTVNDICDLPVISDVLDCSVSEIGNFFVSPFSLPEIDISPALETALQNLPSPVTWCNEPFKTAFDDALVELVENVQWPLSGGGEGTISDLGDQLQIPSYVDAQYQCMADGAHVCTFTEVFMLADGQTPENALGYEGGEWVGTVGDGRPLVSYDPFSGSDFLFAVPWPPITIDFAPLFEAPPGLPLELTPVRVPTGRFRCCRSSSVLP